MLLSDKFSCSGTFGVMRDKLADRDDDVSTTDNERELDCSESCTTIDAWLSVGSVGVMNDSG